MFVQYNPNPVGRWVGDCAVRKEDIDAVYKLIDIAKDIYCIWEYEDKMDDGDEYSNASYARDVRSYNDGGSYARGRRGNVRRDSMGRYSSRGYSRDGYSRDGGKEDYIEHLRDMMESAPDESTRNDIRRMIQKMEQA